MPDEVNELQKEWRAIVISELNGMKNAITQMGKDIGDVKMAVAQAAANAIELAALRKEVDELKEFRAKIIGIVLAINTVAVLIGWAISVMHK